MRIISGKWKGKTLSALVPEEVRPTSDRVRELIFSIIGNYTDIEGLRIADICAGTGALGFEFLSRGASHCTFFEKSTKVEKIISTNAETIGIPNECLTIVRGDIRKTLLPNSTQPYDIIITDPPYAELLINPLLRVIAKNSLLKENGLCITEHAIREVAIAGEEWKLLTQRTIGETMIDFFQFVPKR